ncbi:hypothetical protein PFISCL1PPCAC_9416, partial [Pristionchus fissidentatus]
QLQQLQQQPSTSKQPQQQPRKQLQLTAAQIAKQEERAKAMRAQQAIIDSVTKPQVLLQVQHSQPQLLQQAPIPRLSAADQALLATMAHKLRLPTPGVQHPQQQRVMPAAMMSGADRATITDEVSAAIVDCVLLPENEQLLLLSTRHTIKEPEMIELYDAKMDTIARLISTRFNKDLDVQRILGHLRHLKSCARATDHTKNRASTFRTSIARVAAHLHISSDPTFIERQAAALRATTAPASSPLSLMSAKPPPPPISVKPQLEAVVQPPKAMSPIEATPTMASVIGLKPFLPALPQDTVPEVMKKDEDTVAGQSTAAVAVKQEEVDITSIEERPTVKEEESTVAEVKMEEEEEEVGGAAPEAREKEGKKENGKGGHEEDSKHAIESDFREARRQPKPPEGAGAGSPRKGARRAPATPVKSRGGAVAPASVFTVSIAQSPRPMMRPEVILTPRKEEMEQTREEKVVKPRMSPLQLLQSPNGGSPVVKRKRGRPRKEVKLAEEEAKRRAEEDEEERKKEKEKEEKKAEEEEQRARDEAKKVEEEQEWEAREVAVREEEKRRKEEEEKQRKEKMEKERKEEEEVARKKKKMEDEAQKAADLEKMREEEEKAKEDQKRNEKGRKAAGRDVHMKMEMSADEEEEEEGSTVADEPDTSTCSGGAKGRARTSLFRRLLNAQKDVHVRRYTEDAADWTAFDVFLSKNYQRMCSCSRREPSQSYALDIKRNCWSVYGEEGKETYERKARMWREAGRPRVYWGSQTVVEQEDRLVTDDKGMQVLPLGGGYDGIVNKSRTDSESSQPPLLIKQEDEEMDGVPVKRQGQDEEMIDVEGMEEEAAAAAAAGGGATASSATSTTATTAAETAGGAEEKKGAKAKAVRPKKEPSSDKKKKAARGENKHEDFMHSGNTPRSKGKKAKPDPTKPLIVDGVPVNPLAEPAVANAYGFDPAKDIVALGQGQLKSAYRRGKAQLDTPHIDVKRYKLEVKHDHLLDDDDHDDTYRVEPMEGVEESAASFHSGGGGEMMGAEGMSAQPMGGEHHHPADRPISPALGTPHHHQQQQSPFSPMQPRSASFSRRPVLPAKPAPPPLIPHAPSPLAARRLTASAADAGWAASKSGGGGNGGNGRRRSDAGGERRERERTPGGRSPTRKSSQYSPAELPTTPTTPSTPASAAAAGGSAAAAAAKLTRLSQAEQFSMAAPKVIEAPRLATPVTPTASSAASSTTSVGSSLSKEKEGNDETLPVDLFCLQMARITAEIERANAILAGNYSHNGH